MVAVCHQGRGHPAATGGAGLHQKKDRAGCCAFGADDSERFARVRNAGVFAAQDWQPRQEHVGFGCRLTGGSSSGSGRGQRHAGARLEQQDGQCDCRDQSNGYQSGVFVHAVIMPRVAGRRIGQVAGNGERHG